MEQMNYDVYYTYRYQRTYQSMGRAKTDIMVETGYYPRPECGDVVVVRGRYAGSRPPRRIKFVPVKKRRR
jgi:hypothetical protein